MYDSCVGVVPIQADRWGLVVANDMQEFIEALKKASSAVLEMSMRWDELSRANNDIVQELSGWSEAFNLSLDEVPYTMWAMVEELEEITEGAK